MAVITAYNRRFMPYPYANIPGNQKIPLMYLFPSLGIGKEEGVHRLDKTSLVFGCEVEAYRLTLCCIGGEETSTRAGEGN